MNIFKYSPVTYFQVPNDLVDDKVVKLGQHALKLYLLILRRAQQHSNPTVKVSTQDVVLTIELRRNQHGPARAELQRHNLATCSEIGHGMWEYRLLNPTTGDAISNPRTPFDLDGLTDDEVRSYFLHHLANFDPVEKDGTLLSHCPFHVTTKIRQRPLSVKFAGGGVWHCFGCKKRGRLLEFEKQMAERSGKILTNEEAYVKVRRLISDDSVVTTVEDVIIDP